MNNKPSTRQIKHLVKTPNLTQTTQLVQVTESTEFLWFVVIKSQHCKIHPETPMPVPFSQLILLSPFFLRKLCAAKSFLYGPTATQGEVLGLLGQQHRGEKNQLRQPKSPQGALQAAGKWPLAPSATSEPRLADRASPLVQDSGCIYLHTTQTWEHEPAQTFRMRSEAPRYHWQSHWPSAKSPRAVHILHVPHQIPIKRKHP